MLVSDGDKKPHLISCEATCVHEEGADSECPLYKSHGYADFSNSYLRRSVANMLLMQKTLRNGE